MKCPQCDGDKFIKIQGRRLCLGCGYDDEMSQNPALYRMKVRDQHTKAFCPKCERIREFRFSRFKMVLGKRIAIFICIDEDCRAEIERQF